MGEIEKQFRPFCFSISPILVSKMGCFALHKDFNQKRLLARKDCNALFVVLLPDIFYPQSVVRTHVLGFAIAVMLPYCFSPLADIRAAITSRRSPISI